MPELLTIADFIERFRVSRATIYREHAAGRLPFLKIGAATRIRRQDAEAWLERLAEQAA